MFFHRRQTKNSPCKDSASPPCTATTVAALPASVANKSPRRNERPSSLPRRVPPADSAASPPLPRKACPFLQRQNHFATPRLASAPPPCILNPASYSPMHA